MSLKKCFIKVTDLSTIKFRRQFNSRKKREHPFNFDTSRKLIKSFRNGPTRVRIRKTENSKERLKTTETI